MVNLIRYEQLKGKQEVCGAHNLISPGWAGQEEAPASPGRRPVAVASQVLFPQPLWIRYHQVNISSNFKGPTASQQP